MNDRAICPHCDESLPKECLEVHVVLIHPETRKRIPITNEGGQSKGRKPKGAS